jgi:hypothetical protein
MSAPTASAMRNAAGLAPVQNLLIPFLFLKLLDAAVQPLDDFDLRGAR